MQRYVKRSKRTTPRGLTAYEALQFHGWTVTETGCWEYDGSRFVRGYALVHSRIRGTKLGHRVVWEHLNGPITNDLIVRHTCDNPPCVNPVHLLLGTQQDNSNDKVERGRQTRGGRTHSSKLTELQVRQIRAISTTKNAPSTKELALEYGVAPRTISEIVRRATWSHL